MCRPVWQTSGDGGTGQHMRWMTAKVNSDWRLINRTGQLENVDDKQGISTKGAFPWTAAALQTTD